jgi:hypothetical protein
MSIDDTPLSENEAALFAAVSLIVRTFPPGPHRTMLARLLEEQRIDFLQDETSGGGARRPTRFLRWNGRRLGSQRPPFRLLCATSCP